MLSKFVGTMLAAEAAVKRSSQLLRIRENALHEKKLASVHVWSLMRLAGREQGDTRMSGCPGRGCAESGATLKKALVIAAVLAGATPVASQSSKQNTEPLGAKIPTASAINIKDLRAQLFLEKSGKLSDNIVGTKKIFRNTVIGEGDAGEPADSVMVTITFEGSKNSRASDKVASALGQVKVTQSTKQGKKILMNRVFGGMLFGDNGLSHKAFIVDAATCAPLEIEAKIGRSTKTANIDFSCGE